MCRCVLGNMHLSCQQYPYSDMNHSRNTRNVRAYDRADSISRGLFWHADPLSSAMRQVLSSFIFRWGNWQEEGSRPSGAMEPVRGRASVCTLIDRCLCSPVWRLCWVSEVCLGLDRGVQWRITHGHLTAQRGPSIPFGPVWLSGQVPWLTVCFQYRGCRFNAT